MYMGVLVSGSKNGVLVYDWKTKNKPSWLEWFNPVEGMSPNANMSKSDRFAQTVTNISFNPATINRIIMSGPNSLLCCYKIDTLSTEF